MFIRRTNSIQNFGIFNDYSENDSLPDFKRYNLIYGWNATGKTTLTRLLRCLESGEICEDFPNSVFSININVNDIPTEISQTSLSSIELRLKVFNRDFIEENLDIDLRKNGKAKPIFHLGKTNVEKSNKLNELIEKTEKIKGEQTEIQKEKTNKEGALETLASSIASEIKGLTQTSRQDKYKNYDKRNVKSFFNDDQLSEQYLIGEKLTEEQRDKSKIAINAENKAVINFTLPSTSNVQNIVNQLEGILKTQVLADETIERLKNNPAIEKWVQEGVQLSHHKSGNTCEFCGGLITEQRLDELKKHFSIERQNLINKINNVISFTNMKMQDFNIDILPDKTVFFLDLQEEYEETKQSLCEIMDNIRSTFNRAISDLSKKLKDPYSCVTSSISQTEENQLINNFSIAQTRLNQLINQHNEKANDFDNDIEKNKEILEYGVLKSYANQYQSIEKEIKTLIQTEKTITENLQKIENEINEIKKEIQGTRIACEEINANLNNYLGHGEIIFEDFEDGYSIKRKDEIANNLSEGEKTAICFVYFVASLKDNFDLANGIVVIDDPVSSLDANNIHYAFNFMATHTRDSGQLFILTHNFSFFRKVRSWFNTLKRHKKEKIECYQLSCYLNDRGSRMSCLKKLDEALKKFDSEYHYLFKLLINVNDNHNIHPSYEYFHHLANVGRRVLETFLDFKYPNNSSKYDKIANAKEQNTGNPFDLTKAKFLYDLLHDGSHADFDTGGFDTFRNNPEMINRAIKALLEFIAKIDPVHYENICR